RACAGSAAERSSPAAPGASSSRSGSRMPRTPAPGLRRRRPSAAALLRCASLPRRRSRGYAALASTLAHGLDARLLQDRAHAGGELVVELGELGGVLVAVLELVVLEELAPRSAAREPAEHVFPIDHVLGRYPRRRDDTAHLRHGRHVEARFLERRQVAKAR